MKSTMIQWLFLCSLLLLAIWFYQKKTKPIEGFQQKDRFVLKTDEASYDNFYSEIYDTLMLPEARAKYELDIVLRTLQPEPRFSRMLDVGTGTGPVLSELKRRGFQVRGIDQSKAMIQIAKKKDSSADIVCENVLNPMAYDRASFTHIFCMGLTLYEIVDKPTFFNNCYFWLQNNGYVVLHLADLEQFNPLIPAAKPPVLDSVEQLGPKRITKTEIDFIDFVYVSDYVTKGKYVNHIENFTDKQSQNIRQNERTLTMESREEILRIAREAGFSLKGSFSYMEGPSRDATQEMILLERL